MRQIIKVGDHVQKIHVFDGTADAGKPHGPILTVVKITDHLPVDGPRSIDTIIYLSDNTWEFAWNVVKTN